MGFSFSEILEDSLTRKLLGHDATHAEKTPFIAGVNSRLAFLLHDATKHLSFLKVGYSALEAFLQANCTGPPLDFDSIPVVFPEIYRDDHLPQIQQEISRSLSVDGDDIYPLIPRLELFWLAKVVMSNATLAEAGFNGRRARFRVNYWHQKLLNEKSDTLHDILYKDAEILEQQLSSRLLHGGAAAEEHMVEFYLERANIRTYYGDDVKAREDLSKAATTRHFQYALTGALGKRTKFQQNDISQLVVLAKSRDHEPEPYSSRKSSRAEGGSRKSSLTDSQAHHKSPSLHPKSPLSHRPGTPNLSITSLDTEIEKPSSSLWSTSHDHHPHHKAAHHHPENLLLNDDTLLEHIHFKQAVAVPMDPETATKITEDSALPPRLASMDYSDQPLLFPVDSMILLLTASSITNTSPADGLTREETLPYATRVLEGGSSNWQVYTQALLVRSRIEGYKSRTAERGLLQLQALVDQVIAETTETNVAPKIDGEAGEASETPNTFLPKPKPGESAGVAERLKYIYQLSPPLRWELEAELASRWTTMGGLRTALEIYERLQMHAEIALCLAATDQEAEAVKKLKGLLFANPEVEISSSSELVQLRDPQPADAPRLLCILGDIKNEPKYYVLAWTVSSQRFARAQRSLGRYFVKQGNQAAAANAYTAALTITRLDTPTWFALGCCQLELEDWPAAIESFRQVVSLEDRDAEAWSNLAVALLRLPVPQADNTSTEIDTTPAASDRGDSTPDDEEEVENESSTGASKPDPLKHLFEALRALRRAATLKREDARIWDNYLTVAASIPPSDNPERSTPWNEIIQAMGQVIFLRGKREGESCIDTRILGVLVDYITESYDYPESDSDIDTPNHAEAPTSHPNQHTEQSPHTPPDTPALTQSPTASPRHLPHLPRALLRLIDTQITPLLTNSSTLFTILSRVSLWRHRPADSLAQVEKAWRSVTMTPDIYSTRSGWDSVVARSLELVAAYVALGPLQRERTGGRVLGDKEVGFKSRSALRGVMGRGWDGWEGSEGWDKLEKCMKSLRA